MLASLDRFLISAVLDINESKKILLCSMPLINFRTMKIVLNIFDPVRFNANSTKQERIEAQNKIEQFNQIFLKGTVNQVLISIIALAGVILFNPVTLPGMFLHLGMSMTAIVYTLSSCASFIKYQHAGNFRFPIDT